MLILLSQLHMGKQAEEQQKFGERVSGLWVRGQSTERVFWDFMIVFTSYWNWSSLPHPCPLVFLPTPCAKSSLPCGSF